MIQIVLILFCILIIFAGYAIGRIGHVFLGCYFKVHHWIYGIILIVIGLIFFKDFLKLPILYFGIGLFISDLKDFLHLKIYGKDKPGIKRFWHID